MLTKKNNGQEDAKVYKDVPAYGKRNKSDG